MEVLEQVPRCRGLAGAALGEDARRLKARVEEILAQRSGWYSVAGAALLALLAACGLGQAPEADIQPTDKAQKEQLIQIEAKLFRFPQKPDMRDTQIVGPEKAREWMESLSRIEGADLMSAPSVTVRPGQKTKINVTRKFRYPSKYVSKDNGEVEAAEFTSTDLGLIIEVLPSLRRQIIEMKTNVTIQDFLGFQTFEKGIRQPVFRKVARDLNVEMLPEQTFFFDLGAAKLDSPQGLSWGDLPADLNLVSLDGHHMAMLTARLIEAPASTPAPPVAAAPNAPAAGLGRVLAVNAEHRFVVLAPAKSQHLAVGDLCGFRRDGRQIALVKAYSVETDSVIASWQEGQEVLPQPGDEVGYPEAVWIDAARRLARSPYALKAGEIDLSGIAQGIAVKCPYTEKILRVP